MTMHNLIKQHKLKNIKRFMLLNAISVFILCVWAFHLHVCLNKTCVLGAQGGQKTVLDPIEPELQMVVSLCVGATNGAKVL